MKGLRFILIAGLPVALAACGEADQPRQQAPATATPPETVTTPAPVSFLPAAIRAFGTEPFWSADISGGQLTYTTPDSLDSGGSSASVTRVDGAGSVKFTATLDGQVLEILVTPVAGCSDGMSDEFYPFTVERTLGEDTVSGCAAPAEN